MISTNKLKLLGDLFRSEKNVTFPTISYVFIEKYKISHQRVTFPWKELPDFHIFSHHGFLLQDNILQRTMLSIEVEVELQSGCGNATLTC